MVFYSDLWVVVRECKSESRVAFFVRVPCSSLLIRYIINYKTTTLPMHPLPYTVYVHMRGLTYILTYRHMYSPNFTHSNRWKWYISLSCLFFSEGFLFLFLSPFYWISAVVSLAPCIFYFLWKNSFTSLLLYIRCTIISSHPCEYSHMNIHSAIHKHIIVTEV